MTRQLSLTALRSAGLVACFILLRTCTQVLLKGLAIDLDDYGPFELMASPLPYLCGALFLGQLVVWFGVLRTTPLSIAYPFTSLTVITILLCGVILFGDPLDIGHIAGAAIIMLGLFILLHRERP